MKCVRCGEEFEDGVPQFEDEQIVQFRSKLYHKSCFRWVMYQKVKETRSDHNLSVEHTDFIEQMILNGDEDLFNTHKYIVFVTFQQRISKEEVKMHNKYYAYRIYESYKSCVKFLRDATDDIYKIYIFINGKPRTVCVEKSLVFPV